MSNPKAPTRVELARAFNNDQRMIRAFEELFKIIPAELDTIGGATGDANTRSIQAESTAMEVLKITKGINVLLWLSM